MTDVELLEWQFRIAKLERRQLETLAEAMAEHDGAPRSLAAEAERAERDAEIFYVDAILARASSGAGGGRSGGTATLDLHSYYAALDAAEAESRKEADRAVLHAMCERRLAHMRRRDGFRYVPEPSPLEAFIAAHEGSLETQVER